MTMFGNTTTGFLAGKQVFPVDYSAEVSQRLVDASYSNDMKLASECLEDRLVDVNFVGTVTLKSKKTEVVLRDEAALEVRVEYEEFKTDVTALFLAAHGGNSTLVRRLLSLGANVNHRLFRGYAMTAAVREGYAEILDVLIKAGASQEACEEALLEASYLGHAMFAELLMGSDLIRQQVAVHALVSACCRGYVNVVECLIKCGVDANAIDRVLLQSSKPFLHANIDCYALAAAVVSRQISVVTLLLQATIRTDIKVRLGAWSWDMETGEEFRVGAGLAEPYCITWCAVEYFEATGTILSMLLHHFPPNITHYGRTLLHHAILCNNTRAIEVLLNFHVDKECPVKTSWKTELRPIHLAARLGFSEVLRCLINGGCNVDSRTSFGETAVMICVRYKHEKCLKVLALEGADFGLVDSNGQSASSIAKSTKWTLGFQQAVVDVIESGRTVRSSNLSVFSPLKLATQANSVEAMKTLIQWSNVDLDEQDENGCSAAMIAAENGHVEAFKLLLCSGANVSLKNKFGETAVSLSELNQNSNVIENLMLEFALEEGYPFNSGIHALHCAAKRGDLGLVRVFISRGYDVNAIDDDGYTSLMLAAKGGHGSVCKLLISNGAKCDIKSTSQETALSLARKCCLGSDTENMILDKLATNLVINGTCVKKHIKEGKGTPHEKLLKMLESSGVLRWGKSSNRNVICRAAEVGPTTRFLWNRRGKVDTEEEGLFHVVTTTNKDVHFVCNGGIEMAELWVRGIKLVTRQAIFGN